MIAAFSYARVSSREQEREGYSIPAQRKLLAEYARTRGFSNKREFVDIESAKNPGRKEFTNMLHLLETDSSCRIVLVEKIDRLYRNQDGRAGLRGADRRGVEVHLVKEGPYHRQRVPLAGQVHARHPRGSSQTLCGEPQRGSQEGHARES